MSYFYQLGPDAYDEVIDKRYRVGDCCSRWGHGTYMSRIIGAPAAMGSESQRDEIHPDPEVNIKVKSWV